MKNLLLGGFLGLVVFASPIRAEIAIPELSGPVIDHAQILPAEQRRFLEDEIRAYQPLVQMQIWTLDSLEGEPIERVSIRAAEKWKLGTEKGDNGLLILVALKDRRMRIEVGQGLEGSVPDVMAGRIVDQILRPAFREGDYFAGILNASRQLYSLAGGDLTKLAAAEQRTPKRSVRRGGLSDLIFLVIFIIIFIFSMCSRLGSRRRSFGGGSSWGGGSSGWSGGGSSWSGGGGGFSGGGSSGSW